MKNLSKYYAFRTTVSLLVTALCTALWMYIWQAEETTTTLHCCAILLTVLLPVVLWWQSDLYRQHTRKVLFLLDAIGNNDATIHFSEDEANTPDNRMIHKALNRVAHILYNVKNETAQREKYYELILDCVSTGIVVLNDNDAVYQKNGEALRLLGLNVFTHVRQLSRVDEHLTNLFSNCHAGDKLQAVFSNERGTINLSVRVSDITVRQEHLRILALNDINTELDEKEIDSWVRLTRVLTHEIMNAVTPITSLSDTLLELTQNSAENDEVRNGLQTISSTGKGLLAFVESYRRFTRIPTPELTLFYVKGFLLRMVELAHHQFPTSSVAIQVDVMPDNLILHADENLIAQVIINLLKNALQAIESSNLSPETGLIKIHAYCDESEAVVIEVSNNGPSIAPEVAEHIFVPFFTTKSDGSGIGLSISRQIMRISGGNIALRPGKLTTFVLTFY